MNVKKKRAIERKNNLKGIKAQGSQVDFFRSYTINIIEEKNNFLEVSKLMYMIQK